AMKFVDLVHALKSDPVTGVDDTGRLFEFLSFMPEATHMLVWLYSDMGIPKSYRHMAAFGVDTYVWINGRGAPRYVRYHWRPAARNAFAESQQLGFSPSALVPGIELSTDKLLQGRAFAYPDAQRHRLGANYLQLPVNRPRIGVHNQQQDGQMAIDFGGSSAN